MDAIQRGQCILFSVVFTPTLPNNLSSVWLLTVISLLKLTLFRRCGLAYLYDWRGFVGAKEKTRAWAFHSSMMLMVSQKDDISLTTPCYQSPNPKNMLYGTLLRSLL
jgi:hypothetical protein